MKDIKLKFQNFEHNITIVNVDVVCVERVQHTDTVLACSLVNIEISNSNLSLSVKFEWLDSLYEFSYEDFLFVPESDIAFFRSAYQWGAIDIRQKLLIRHEDAHCFPSITKRHNFILIEDELYAESVTFRGEKIDNVPIDPPYEVREFDDRIEYTSPVYGFQVLKIK